MYKELAEKLSNGTEIYYDEPMKNHTTFKIGGVADVMIIPQNQTDIIKIILFSKEKGIPVLTLGNGSNLLIGDEGIRGIVIKTSNAFNDIKIIGNEIIAGTGVSITKLSHTAGNNSLGGMEWAYGIPGTVGGAIVMNAGAYGGEMKDIVESVKYISENGELCELNNEELKFSYRKSIFETGERSGIIAECRIKLKEGDKIEILNKMQEYLSKRKEKQPVELPSAGSTFKRPEGHFTGQMIEELGLRGYSIGGAQVSEKHAGFIINKGNATAEDVKELIRVIRERVKEKYNVDLEPEIKIL